MAEENVKGTVEYGAGGVPKGSLTSDYYRCKNIPDRFNNPGGCHSAGNPVFSCQLDFDSKKVDHYEGQQSADALFQGYESKAVHPMYRTTSAQYGNTAPTVHTMPTEFYCKSQKFSLHLGTCGMYRNHSLNTAKDTSCVPDH